MTDTTENKTTGTVDFTALMAKTNMPEQATAPIVDAMTSLYSLVITQNQRVIRIQQSAKQLDPNNTDLVDSLWRNAVDSGSAPANVSEAEKEYQDLIARAEKILLETLRPFGKTQIQAPLSETELQSERKLANEAVTVIAEAKQRATAMAEIADQLLSMVNAKPDDGIMSLIPNVESVRNARGRKPGTSTGTAYRFRYGTIKLDGEAIYQERKVKGELTNISDLIVAASELNNRWNTDAITEEMLETAMYESQGITGDIPTMRGRKDELKDEFDFEFKTTIQVPNKNDDGSHDEPHQVKITVMKNVRDTKSDDSEVKSDDAEVTEAAKPEVTEEKVIDPVTKTEANVGPVTKALRAKQEAMKQNKQ